MKLRITKRKLNEEEIDVIVHEQHAFPYLGFVHKDLWKQFRHTFVVTEHNTFVGVCAAFPLTDWTKLGPIVVRSKFHGKGYGKILLTHIVNYYRNRNVYIGSPNPTVWKIASSLGFEKTGNMFRVPVEIQFYLLSYLFTRFSLPYITDSIKKRLKTPHRKYYYFFKRALQV